jgi:hypothetical protein
MVTSNDLAYLSSQKIRDSKVLLANNRNGAAVYLIGYALEFALKRKIINTLAFQYGFPETRADFNLYTAQITAFNAISTGVGITQLRQIRNHNLNDLLTFSGAETRIKNSYLLEWLIVETWNPEDRYVIRRFTLEKAKLFVKAAVTILQEIH